MENAKIYNLTQHNPTPSQVAAGVALPLEGASALLNFESQGIDVRARARNLTLILVEAWFRDTGINRLPNPFVGKRPKVMIGGIPRLMGPLERHLTCAGFQPVYSFSERRCVETIQPDGTVKTDRLFEHVGFDSGTYAYDENSPYDWDLRMEAKLLLDHLSKKVLENREVVWDSENDNLDPEDFLLKGESWDSPTTYPFKESGKAFVGGIEVRWHHDEEPLTTCWKGESNNVNLSLRHSPEQDSKLFRKVDVEKKNVVGALRRKTKSLRDKVLKAKNRWDREEFRSQYIRVRGLLDLATCEPDPQGDNPFDALVDWDDLYQLRFERFGFR